MVEMKKLHVPKFVDHIGVKAVYEFFEEKIELYDMLFMDSINITNWKFSVDKGESQYLSNIKIHTVDDKKRIINRARINIHIVQNFRKYKEWIEIGSSKKDEVASVEAAQELQIYPVVQSKYPEHFDVEKIVRKIDDFSFKEETHFFHILKQTKFESKEEVIIWNLGHCMYWYLKELDTIGSKKSETSANRFAFLWLYEFCGSKIDWPNTEFAK